MPEQAQRVLDGIRRTPDLLAESRDQREPGPRFDRRGLPEHDLLLEDGPDTVEVTSEVEPDLEVVIEGQHRDPVVRCQPGEQSFTLLEYAQQPDQAFSLHAFLNDEDDQPATNPRLEYAGDLRRRDAAAPGHRPADPLSGLDAHLLAVDADVKVGRVKTDNGSPGVVDHPYVDDDARDVHALYPLWLLGCQPEGREPGQRQDHAGRPGAGSPGYAHSLTFHDRLVRHDPESFLDVGRGRKDLRHQNPDQLLCGVHPERGVEETAPIIGTL